MKKKEDLVYYDFQGWPVFKKNLKELLLQLGGEERGKQIIFDSEAPSMEVYPRLLEDDGMAYGVNEAVITEASVFQDEDGKTYINIFREPTPTKEKQEELIKKWEEDEAIVKAETEAYYKKIKENKEK